MNISEHYFYCNHCNKISLFKCDYTNLGTVEVLTSNIDAKFDIVPSIICPQCGNITNITVNPEIPSMILTKLYQNDCQVIECDKLPNQNITTYVFTTPKKIKKRAIRKIIANSPGINIWLRKIIMISQSYEYVLEVSLTPLRDIGGNPSDR